MQSDHLQGLHSTQSHCFISPLKAPSKDEMIHWQPVMAEYFGLFGGHRLFPVIRLKSQWSPESLEVLMQHFVEGSQKFSGLLLECDSHPGHMTWLHTSALYSIVLLYIDLLMGELHKIFKNRHYVKTFLPGIRISNEFKSTWFQRPRQVGATWWCHDPCLDL